VGIPPQADEGLRRLLSTGALSWSGGKPQLAPPVELAAGGTSVSRMVLEDRGDPVLRHRGLPPISHNNFRLPGAPAQN